MLAKKKGNNFELSTFLCDQMQSHTDYINRMITMAKSATKSTLLRKHDHIVY
jgi:hypothetical protein